LFHGKPQLGLSLETFVHSPECGHRAEVGDRGPTEGL